MRTGCRYSIWFATDGRMMRCCCVRSISLRSMARTSAKTESSNASVGSPVCYVGRTLLLRTLGKRLEQRKEKAMTNTTEAWHAVAKKDGGITVIAEHILTTCRQRRSAVARRAHPDSVDHHGGEGGLSQPEAGCGCPPSAPEPCLGRCRP
jgi:hypothetical protein